MRAKLSRDKVLQAAVELIDEEGLKKLSMRRLGQQLGVEAMSLYRYVANKAELLDGVHGRIIEEMEIPELPEGWRAQLHALAYAFRSVLQKHPRALPLFAGRPAVTAGALDHIDKVFAALEQAGFEPKRRIQVFKGLASFVIGSANLQFAVSENPGKRVDWSLLDGDRYPQLAENGPLFEVNQPDEEFAFSLEVFLNGLVHTLSLESD